MGEIHRHIHRQSTGTEGKGVFTESRSSGTNSMVQLISKVYLISPSVLPTPRNNHTQGTW